MTYNASAFPISIKGIVLVNEKIVLLKNEREEWELPGGRIEIGETPEECVVREIDEELNLKCVVDRIVDTWMYTISNQKNVFIVTYLCEKLTIDPNVLKISHEHKELGLFNIEEIEHLNMPLGYKNTIRKVIHSSY
ncbi:NUDIX domain-containing protein [Bergeyella porcorum]|uniref:NUDIX hydrolase n=1 Tax=Bergeyella porcorum TaxID=1735111 RepID=UPI0035EFDBD8